MPWQKATFNLTNVNFFDMLTFQIKSKPFQAVRAAVKQNGGLGATSGEPQPKVAK